MYRVIQEYVAIHEMGKESKRVPVQYAWVGQVASLPPPPCSVDGAMGEGEGWRAGPSLGILSRVGGISGKQAAS